MSQKHIACLIVTLTVGLAIAACSPLKSPGFHDVGPVHDGANTEATSITKDGSLNLDVEVTHTTVVGRLVRTESVGGTGLEDGTTHFVGLTKTLDWVISGVWTNADGAIYATTMRRTWPDVCRMGLAVLDGAGTVKKDCVLTPKTSCPNATQLPSRILGMPGGMIVTTFKGRDLIEVSLADPCTITWNHTAPPTNGSIYPITKLALAAPLGTTSMPRLVGAFPSEGSAVVLAANGVALRSLTFSSALFPALNGSNLTTTSMVGIAVDASLVSMLSNFWVSNAGMYAVVVVFDLDAQSSSPRWTHTSSLNPTPSKTIPTGFPVSGAGGIAMRNGRVALVGLRGAVDGNERIVVQVFGEKGATIEAEWFGKRKSGFRNVKDWSVVIPTSPPAIVSVPGGFLVVEGYADGSPRRPKGGFTRLSWLDMSGHLLLVRDLQMPAPLLKGETDWLSSEPWFGGTSIAVPYGRHILVTDRWGNASGEMAAKCAGVADCHAPDELCSLATCLGDGKCTIIHAEDGEPCPKGSCSDGKCMKKIL